ncbi:MAG TPA: hypothetical protein VK652_08375, partial [Steroidobacteraceae bacterium]|nr:hypothetical protein [Steroidobacteraceae bacterium]
WSIGASNMLAGVVGQFTSKYENQGTVNSPAANELDLGTPKWLSRGRLQWQFAQFDSTVFVNYTGKYQNDLSVNGGTVPYTAGAYTTVDLHLGYTLPDQGWTKGTIVSLDVEDLFDRSPAETPAGPAVYTNVIGRVFRLGVRKSW